ncbi:MAG: geranylgeranylglycerol-phosphate geranylgeranyltransferase [Ignavibacteriales bacterium]|nr:geranylgeranylglycerol-phosphate geranylgeranyltransferase [Ignavibacteriales bacterium]
MSSDKVKAYIQLLRPLNIGIVFLTIAAASVLAGAHVTDWLLVLLASAAGAFIAGGGNAINDYFDVAIDAINKPERPLPRGAVNNQEAWWLWRLTSSVGSLISAFLGPISFAIALFWVVSLFFYSRVFKRKVLVGNIMVAVMTGLAFVYGAVVVGNVGKSWIPASFAFLINLARELVKDAEDIEGDAQGNANTLPVKHGIRATLLLASLVIVCLIGATLLPFSGGVYNSTYLLIVSMVDVALLYVLVSMWRNWSPVNLNKLSMILKLNMVVGLAAIFFGS